MNFPFLCLAANAKCLLDGTMLNEWFCYQSKMAVSQSASQSRDFRMNASCWRLSGLAPCIGAICQFAILAYTVVSSGVLEKNTSEYCTVVRFVMIKMVLSAINLQLVGISVVLRLVTSSARFGTPTHNCRLHNRIDCSFFAYVAGHFEL